jgi:hypothetical protein
MLAEGEGRAVWLAQARKLSCRILTFGGPNSGADNIEAIHRRIVASGQWSCLTL